MMPPDLRPILGFPGYGVAEDRSVWSHRGGVWRRLATFKRPETGDVRVHLYRGGRAYWRPVEQVWRDAWGPEAMVPGKHPTGHVVGSRHGRSRLDESKVAEARRLHREGATERVLARRYGVSNGAMHHALVGDTWRHIP